MKIPQKACIITNTSLYTNSIYISLSFAITSISGFLFWGIATHIYSSKDVGIASTVISALNLIFITSLLGLHVSLIRFYPEYREKAIGSTILTTSILAGGISIVYSGISIKSNLFDIKHPALFLILITLFSILGTNYYVVNNIAIAKRKVNLTVVQSSMFSLRILFLFMFAHVGMFGILGSFGLGLVLGILVIILELKEEFPGKFSGEYLNKAIKLSLGNYLSELSNKAIGFILPTITLFLLGPSKTAYLYITIAITNLVMIIPTSISTSLLVEGTHTKKPISSLFKRALILSWVYLLFVIIMTALWGDYILSIFGEEYSSNLKLLNIMMVSGFPATLILLYSSWLNIKRDAKTLIALNLLKAFVFFLCVYPLVSQFDIVGIGYAWLISNSLAAIGTLILLAKS